MRARFIARPGRQFGLKDEPLARIESGSGCDPLPPGCCLAKSGWEGSWRSGLVDRAAEWIGTGTHLGAGLVLVG